MLGTPVPRTSSVSTTRDGTSPTFVWNVMNHSSIDGVASTDWRTTLTMPTLGSTWPNLDACRLVRGGRIHRGDGQALRREVSRQGHGVHNAFNLHAVAAMEERRHIGRSAHGSRPSADAKGAREADVVAAVGQTEERPCRHQRRVDGQLLHLLHADKGGPTREHGLAKKIYADTRDGIGDHRRQQPGGFHRRRIHDVSVDHRWRCWWTPHDNAAWLGAGEGTHTLHGVDRRNFDVVFRAGSQTLDDELAANDAQVGTSDPVGNSEVATFHGQLRWRRRVCLHREGVGHRLAVRSHLYGKTAPGGELGTNVARYIVECEEVV
eukprot:scaffold1102_cov256-Pinguiococcus_pyrenoidosus.AAC.23